jgi:hypothetical protein
MEDNVNINPPEDEDPIEYNVGIGWKNILKIIVAYVSWQHYALRWNCIGWDMRLIWS